MVPGRPSAGEERLQGDATPGRLLLLGALFALALSLLLTSLLTWAPANLSTIRLAVLATLGVSASALVLGLPLGGALRRRAGIGALEALVHSFALGAGAIVLLVLTLGSARVLTARVLLVALALGLGLGLARMRKSLLVLADAVREGEALVASPLGGALGLGGLALLLLPVLPALAPAWFYDALLYHLEAPDLWLRTGRLTAAPYNFYLNYPLNMSALYLAARAIAPSPLVSPALLHVVFFAASAFAIVALARPLGPRTALLAGLLFAASPAALETASYPIADHAVVLWTLAAACALLAHAESGDERVGNGGDGRSEGGGERAGGVGGGHPNGARLLLVVAGLELGLAIGAKYTAILVGLLPALVLVFAGAPRRTLGRRVADALLVVLGCVGTFSPWLARNGVETGNPIYPYVFEAREPFNPHHSLEAEIVQRAPPGSGITRWITHLASGPRELLTRGAGAAPLPGLHLLLPLPFLLVAGFARRRETREAQALHPRVKRLLVLGLVGFAAWDATVHVTRYGLPFLALLAPPAAWAVGSMRGVRARRALAALVVVALAQSAFLGFLSFNWSYTLALVRGRIAPTKMLEDTVSYYGAAKWLDDNLGAGTRVLFVGESRGFYCRPDHVTVATTRPSLLVEAAEAVRAEVGAAGAADAGGADPDVRRWLRGRGFTHVLVHGPEMERIARDLGPGIFTSRDPAAQAAIERFLRDDAVEVFADGKGVRVLAIR